MGLCECAFFLLNGHHLGLITQYIPTIPYVSAEARSRPKNMRSLKRLQSLGRCAVRGGEKIREE